jgi:ribosomal protein L7/L12
VKKSGLIFGGALLFLLPCTLFANSQAGHLAKRELEVDFILHQLGIDPAVIIPPPADPVRRLLLAKNKLQAIRLYRERAGVGTKEAVEAVEAMDQEMSNFATRLAQLETKVDFLLRQLGIDPAMITPPPADLISEALRAGNIVQAIKLYRELHGGGIREAKEAVEALRTEMGL